MSMIEIMHVVNVTTWRGAGKNRGLQSTMPLHRTIILVSGRTERVWTFARGGGDGQ